MHFSEKDFDKNSVKKDNMISKTGEGEVYCGLAVVIS
jgi:hypothetical protein